jgi:monofunctional glycosyltransferase
MKAASAKAYRYLKRGLLILVGIVLLWLLWLFGWVLWWNWVDPGETSFMAIRMAELQVKKPEAKMEHQWVPYAKISNHLKRAIVAAEDAKFVDHEGSTISQQLAKNLFLSPRKSMLRKVEEAAITIMIETVWSKRRILEVYLNVIEWGNGVFGAEAAARHYYGISAERLGVEQAAKMAGMVPNPRLYDRNRGAPGLARKTGVILSRMAEAEIP